MCSVLQNNSYGTIFKERQGQDLGSLIIVSRNFLWDFPILSGKLYSFNYIYIFFDENVGKERVGSQTKAPPPATTKPTRKAAVVDEQETQGGAPRASAAAALQRATSQREEAPPPRRGLSPSSPPSPSERQPGGH